jgi:hypothetical protein
MDKTVLLYTSSSEHRRRSGRAHRRAFVASALMLTLAIWAIWNSSAFVDHVVLETVAAPTPTAEHFLVVTDLNAVGAYVYLHEFEDVCPSIRNADVVFFGDSRLQFAFRGEELRSYFAKRGLSYYLLGFPNGTDRLALTILERCNAKPKIAVVQESGFFGNELPTNESVVLASSAFEAFKIRTEFELAYFLRSKLHLIFPHPVGRDLAGGSWILYRSRLDGSWWVAAGTQGDFPVNGGAVRKVRIPRVQLNAAERFKSVIEAGGGRLLLTYVPTRNIGRARAHTIAKHLGVPVLDPRLAGLRTADGVHLLIDSAERFARRFTELLDGVL